MLLLVAIIDRESCLVCPRSARRVVMSLGISGQIVLH